MEVLLGTIVRTAIAYFTVGRTSRGKQQIPADCQPDSFIAIDLKTTGLDAARHEIIEVAAIRYRKGGTAHDSYQSLIQPKRKIPTKVTEITGITQEMVEQEGKQLAVVLHEFTQFIGNEPLVTFNAEFDMEFLHAAWERNGMARPANKVSCVLNMARRAWPNSKSYRLIDLSSARGIAELRAYRALADARRALVVYVATVAQLKVLA